MTDELLEEIRARHRKVDSGGVWKGADDPVTAAAAFEDRADLLAEVDRLRERDKRLQSAIGDARHRMSIAGSRGTPAECAALFETELTALCAAWDIAIVETRVRVRP